MERSYLLKRQNKRYAVIVLAACMFCSSMMLGGCAGSLKKQKLPAATYMGGNNTITEICKELR